MPGPILDWAQAPTNIEIGAGVGWHAVRYGMENPERRLVAIEHTQEKFAKMQRRVENHPQLQNVYAVHANAIHWMTHFAPLDSAERIFTLFPNPYPKHSQSNKRWHRMPFFERLVDTLKVGGTWTLATNEEFYWKEAEQMLSQHSRLELTERLEYSAAKPAPWGVRTHFEKKYILQGMTCVQLTFRRRS